MQKKQISLITTIFVLVANWVLAQELGVTITKVSGDCEVMRAREVKWIPANVEMRLYLNDRIRTKFISKATLKFDDGTIIQMKENTTIDIKELFENKLTGRTKSEMKIWLGEILGTIEKLKTKDSEFNIQTPVAIIGIRGTKIKVKVGSRGETTCYVQEGNIRMRGISEPEDKWTIIEENKYSTCITGKEVSIPEKFKPLPPEEEEEIEPLSEILKRRKEKITLSEKVLPYQPVLPAPEINAQFPEQNKPFINKIPNVTIFISPLPRGDIKEIPTCFLQIEDDKPIELPKGATKYRFRPYLKPGVNELAIKAWYAGGQVGKTVIRFPFFDPQPPIIQSMKDTVQPLRKLAERINSEIFTSEEKKFFKEKIPIEISVIAADLGSGIREVIVNGRRMEKIREKYYNVILFLSAKMTVEKEGSYSLKEKYKVKKVSLSEEVKLRVTDKADNSITEIMDSKRIENDIEGTLERALNRLYKRAKKIDEMEVF